MPSSVVHKAAPRTIARPRILAVDDTPEALRQLRDCLKTLNADCFSCGSGASAMEFLSKEMVDLAIVDVSMPGMDGFEVCRAIKHGEHTKDIPVILLTGDIKTEDTHRGIELGAFDYLTKPVDQHECTVRVHAALQMKQVLDELHVQLLAPDEQRRAHTELQQKISDFQQGMTTTHWQKRFGQLSASFIDDIHAPLAQALAGIQNLMVDDRIKDDLRQQLFSLHTQFRKINDHMRRLLTVAVYSRRAHLMRPAEVVSDMTKLLEPEFSYYGIHLTLNLDPTVEWWGMRSEISRAILYLLQNAIEALTERGPAILRRRMEDDAEEEQRHEDPNKVHSISVKVEILNPRVVIRIADNGPGIPKELHDRIWDPHFTTKTPPHTGAGLHLARAIVHAAGGEIELQSPGPDCSTQFSILLPINSTDVEPADDEEPSSGEESNDAQAGQAQEEPAVQA